MAGHGFTATVRNLAGNVHSGAVIARSGMVEFARPDRVAANYLDVRTFGAVVAPLRVATRRYPDRLAIIDEMRSITFRELDRTSTALARGIHESGFGPEAVIGTVCRDHIPLVETMMAAGKLGARLVLLNTSLSPHQLADVCSREGISIVVHDDLLKDLLEFVPPTIQRYVADGAGHGENDASLARLIEENMDKPGLGRPRKPGALVALTGGTTGVPKGAVRRINSPLAAAQFLERIPLPRNGVTFLAAPMFHGTALSQFLLSMALGTTNVMRTKFDPLETLAAIETFRCTTLVLVPTMLQRIISLGDDVISSHDTRSLQVLFCAGSALPSSLGDEATRLFGDVVYNLYGTSEVGVATVATPDDWKEAPGTVGRPPRSCRVAIYDQNDALVVGPDQKGTIYVGSALSFDGYTGGGGKKTLNGLLSSGDVGHWDIGGRLFIDGRDDDMIVSGGENVFPGEIENLLYAHSAVMEAAVIPVPDSDFGQRLAAVLVLNSGATFTEDDVKTYVREHLARFKVPRDVWFVTKLPRTPVGKLLRQQLIIEYGS